MIILQGHIVVPTKDLPAVLQELETHIELTRREQGCLAFEVTRDEAAGNVFSVYEAFSDRPAFERHQQRVRSSRWGQVAENVERHYRVSETPEQ